MPACWAACSTVAPARRAAMRASSACARPEWLTVPHGGSRRGGEQTPPRHVVAAAIVEPLLHGGCVDGEPPDHGTSTPSGPDFDRRPLAGTVAVAQLLAS